MRVTSWLALGCVSLLACGDGSPGNTRPTIEGATLSTPEDTPLSVPIVASSGSGASPVFSVGAAGHGKVSGTAPALTYTPDPDYHGSDSFTVSVSNGVENASAVINIAVAAVNDAPIAKPDALATNEDTQLTLATGSLLQNDTDIDGDTLSVTAVGNPVHGTVELVEGSIHFLPTRDYVGDATFEYTISDGSATATAIVTVAVGGDNDAPVAVADALTTAEDTVLRVPASAVLGNDTDAENQTLTVTAVADASSGTVVLNGTTIEFAPAADFSGDATFRYTVKDGAASSDATVTVTVTPVNDAPRGVADAVATNEDSVLNLTAATLLANDSDVEGQALALTAVGGATNGTVSLAGDAITFTPAANFVGNASFVYTVSDGELTADVAVTVAVAAVNDAPVASDDAVTGTEDVAVTTPALQLLANDTDVDGDSLSVVAVGNAQHGTVALSNGAVVFTPERDFHGVASYEYTVSDGVLTDVGAVAVSLAAANDKPVAVDDTLAGTEDTVLTVAAATLLANDTDPDNDALSVVGVAAATGGNVVLNGGNIEFTPAVNFNGAARFTYLVSDGSLTDDATVTVNVAAVNDAPVPAADVATTVKNTAVTVAVLTNDTDPENQALTVTAVTGAANGTATIVTGRQVRYVPTAGFTGIENLRYTVSDGAATAQADLTIRVNGVCGDSTVDANETCDDGNAVALDGCSEVCEQEVCGDGIRNNRVTSAPSAAYVEYVATCANSQPLTLTVNGTVIALPTDTACTCSAGIKRYDFTAAQIAALRIGNNTLAVATPSGALLAWLNLVATNPATQSTTTTTIFDQNGAPGANDRNPDLCASGYLGGATASITHDFGFIDVEQCDDGNTDPNDGCAATCTLECGDGVQQPQEACDDGNRADDDGCSATCTVECGDGVKQPHEECDDGNDTDPLDGCHACRLPACGDNVKQATEACDDGNTAYGDGCRGDCKGLEVCGDGLIDYAASESCDDQNTDANDGCNACRLTCPAEVAPRVISGTMSCNTLYSNTGRKVTVDAGGGLYGALRCGAETYAVATVDGGINWRAPVRIFPALTNIAELAIEGGPGGVAYAVALANGRAHFSRSLDNGATWSAPEDLGPYSDSELSLDSLGDSVFLAVNNGNFAVYRNNNRGAAGSWQSVNVTMSQAYFEVMADRVTGNIVLASDTPDFHIRISSDGAETFGAEFAPAGQVYYSDWSTANGFLYTAGTSSGSNTLYKVDLTAKTSSTVTGLPTINTSQARALDTSPAGDVFVASQLDSGNVQIDRYRRTPNSIATADVRAVGQGTYPAIGANACGESAVYLYTRGTSVYAGVASY